MTDVKKTITPLAQRIEKFRPGKMDEDLKWWKKALLSNLVDTEIADKFIELIRNQFHDYFLTGELSQINELFPEVTEKVRQDRLAKAQAMRFNDA